MLEQASYGTVKGRPIHHEEKGTLSSSLILESNLLSISRFENWILDTQILPWLAGLISIRVSSLV